MAENYNLNVNANYSGNLNRSVESLNKNMDRLGNITKTVGVAFGTVFGGQQILRLGENTLNTIKKLDGMNRALHAITDSQMEYARAVHFTNDIADRFGVELIGLTDSYIRFTAAVRGTTIQGQQAEEIFSNMAKSGAILGLSAAEMNGVFRALSQIMSKGKVQAEELRLQLGDRLPGAVRIMAKALNVTTGELEEMLKKGEVMADIALPKFSRAYLEAVGADKVERIETLTAAQNRLRNSWTALVKSIDEGNGVISSVFRGITEGISSAAEMFTFFNNLGDERVRSNAEILKEIENNEELRRQYDKNSNTYKLITESIRLLRLELGPLNQNVQSTVPTMQEWYNTLNLAKRETKQVTEETERFRKALLEIEKLDTKGVTKTDRKFTEMLFQELFPGDVGFDSGEIRGIEKLDELAKQAEERSVKLNEAAQKINESFFNINQAVSVGYGGFLSTLEQIAAGESVGKALGGFITSLMKFAGQTLVQSGLNYLAAAQLANSTAAIMLSNPITAPGAGVYLAQAASNKAKGMANIGAGVALGAVGAVGSGLLQRSGGSGVSAGGGFAYASSGQMSNIPDKIYMYAEGDQLKAVLDLNNRNNTRRGR